MLGVIADVAHLSRREEELDAVARDLTQLAQEMSRFCEHDHRHGKQIAAVARSVQRRAAVQLARRPWPHRAALMGFGRNGTFSMSDEAEIPGICSYCDQFAEDYQRLADAADEEAA